MLRELDLLVLSLEADLPVLFHEEDWELHELLAGDLL
jgi:hypothetical protein